MNEAMRARYARIANTAQLDHLTAAREEIVEDRMNKDSFADREEVFDDVAGAPAWEIVQFFDKTYEHGWLGFVADFEADILSPEPVR